MQNEERENGFLEVGEVTEEKWEAGVIEELKLFG